MGAWLRFIDKKAYYISKFIKEAQQVGVGLTVSLETLKEMEWNDRVCLLQANGAPNVKSPVLFAAFPIERITGLTAAATAFLSEELPAKLEDMGGDLIERGEHQFNTGFVYEIDAPLSAVAEKLIAFKDYGSVENIGIPMLCCRPESIRVMTKPLPMFRDIAPRTGYRRFDLAGVNERIKTQRGWNGKKRPDIRGQWNPNPTTAGLPLAAFPGSVESAVIFDRQSKNVVS